MHKIDLFKVKKARIFGLLCWHCQTIEVSNNIRVIHERMLHVLDQRKSVLKYKEHLQFALRKIKPYSELSSVFCLGVTVK